MSREAVSATPRRTMTEARKRRVHDRASGLCEEPTCAKPLPLTGPTVAYDHIIALELGGGDEDRNLQLLCFGCHAVKTAYDLALIAKNRRLRAREDGTRRERQPIQSRGFEKPKVKKAWPSRKFNNQGMKP